MPDSPRHQIVLKKDGIELILRTHHHVEDGDKDSEAGANHADKQQCLCLQFFLRFAQDDELEEHVGRQLREVLCPE